MNESGKVIGFEFDYIDSSEPGSYVDTSGGFDANDAVRHKSSKKSFNPSVHMKDFRLDLRFKDFKCSRMSLLTSQLRKDLSSYM